MSTELTVFRINPEIKGGLGLDFASTSKLFALKPGTINIVQPNSQAEGAIKGNFIISETGDQYPELRVALLQMPVEQRQYHTGEAGQLNRTPENLMCFSKDMVRPDRSAKVPQAMACNGCPKQDWKPFFEYRDNHPNQQIPKNLIPPCDSFYHAIFADTVFQIPLQMYIRSKSKKPFEAGMQNLARTFAKLKSQGKNPNIFDISFKMTTSLITTGKFTSYVLKLSDFKPIEDGERESFGDMYLAYTNRGKKTDEQLSDEQIADADTAINAEVLGSSSVSDEEITI